MIFRESLFRQTRGRGLQELTAEVEAIVSRSRQVEALCHVFLHHTSASLILCENADPSVLVDVEGHLARLVPDGHPAFTHTAEGRDDMAAHLRTLLTRSDLTLPVSRGRLDLGTWQGLFLYEHRLQPHRRRLTVTVLS